MLQYWATLPAGVGSGSFLRCGIILFQLISLWCPVSGYRQSSTDTAILSEKLPLHVGAAPLDSTAKVVMQLSRAIRVSFALKDHQQILVRPVITALM